MRHACASILLSGCFVLSRDDLRRHDAEILAGAETDGDVDATPGDDIPEPETFALTLEGEGFGSSEGYHVLAYAFDAEGDEVASGRARVGEGTFELAFRRELPVGGPYVVDVLVEFGGDDFCASGSGYYYLELPYRLEDVSSGGRDRRLVVNATTDLDVEACASFP